MSPHLSPVTAHASSFSDIADHAERPKLPLPDTLDGLQKMVLWYGLLECSWQHSGITVGIPLLRDSQQQLLETKVL